MFVVGLPIASACAGEFPIASMEAEQEKPQPRPSAGAAANSRKPDGIRTGLATFISNKLEGRKTASGEIYDGSRMVAAHPTYPMGTVVRVTNQENARVVDVTIIDRSARGARRPIIDLSRQAAERLDFVRRGTVQVKTEVIEWPRGTAK